MFRERPGVRGRATVGSLCGRGEGGLAAPIRANFEHAVDPYVAERLGVVDCRLEGRERYRLVRPVAAAVETVQEHGLPSAAAADGVDLGVEGGDGRVLHRDEARQ